MKHWIASGCLLAAIGTCTLASAQNSFVGTWKLNQAKSHLTGETVTYSSAANGTIRETTAVGSYTFKTDDRPYSTAFGSYARWKHPSPSTWETSYRRKEMLLDSDTTAISADGKTMTVISTGTSPDGKAFHDTEVFTRVEGTSGLMGTWKSEKVKSSTSPVIEFAANGADGITWILPEIKAKLDMKFNGKDYAPVGPTVPEGLTIAATKNGDRSFSFVEKMNGKPLFKGSMRVSADGKTLTDVSTPVSTEQKRTAVYDKQ
ncbi:MAG: hypothetical protein ACLQMO_06915 [Acidobacteriaceae bacterium]